MDLTKSSWCVEIGMPQNKTNPVIQYLNGQDSNRRHDGSCKYYGYNHDKRKSNCTNDTGVHDNIQSIFGEDAIELTMEQFIQYRDGTIPWRPKIDEWVYAERATSDEDYRKNKYVPLFQLKQISDCERWLRAEKDIKDGVHIKWCRPALPNEIPTKNEQLFPIW